MNKNQKLVNKLANHLQDIYRPKKYLLHQFLRGLFYGLGATLGVAILLATLGYILSFFGVLDSFRDWLNNINFVK